jgi:hypothetical protein
MLLHAFQYMLGGLLILLVLLDVFLTVLYARIGAGVFTHRLACWTWRTFRVIAKPFPRQRDRILSFCGPTILVLLVTVWVFGVMCGAAMIIQPEIGNAIRAQDGASAEKSFITALYIAGDSMATVGASDYRPETPFFKLLYTFLAIVGISMITLTVTYFLEIYNALQQRNTFAVKMHHASGDSGDAAELVCGVGAQGKFEAGYGHLSEMAAETMQLFEAHHFYAVLTYFRFAEPYYALSRMALLNLDTVTLIKAGLSDEKCGWLKESAAVTQLWSATMQALVQLAETFLPQGIPEGEPSEQDQDRWRRRYHLALDRFRQAGIDTIEDVANGEETYIALRARWDRYLWVFARHMVHPMEQMDIVGCDPAADAAAARRPPFSQRLRAAG